jgi:hypothetical protein
MPPTRRWKETAQQSIRGHLGWVLSLFLIGLGIKFMMVLKSDSPLPYYDQWDAEAVNTYLPYFHHTLSIAGLFKAHNEHRIFFTRVYDLLLLLLNGQWDSELQMALNAILQCAALAGFGWLMARLMGRENWLFIWPPLVLALVLPFGWENTLAGFQSQFYFLLIFALLTLWLLGMNEPWTLRWSLGVVAGILGLFTMASGFVAEAAVGAMSVLDMGKEPRTWRRHLPTLLVCAGITASGLLLKVDVPKHHIFKAQSLLALEKSLGRNLAWPVVQGWDVPLNLLPLILLAWMYAHSRERQSPAERMILATGFWAILQGMAAAYARGGEFGHAPAWRYMDLESFIMTANCLSIVLLMQHYRQQLWRPPIWYAGFALWGVACIAGLWFLTNEAGRKAIPAWAVSQGKRLAAARAFMATDDPHVFDDVDDDNLPYPNREELTSLLRDQDIRRILPACAREPLRVARNGEGDGAFVTNGCVLANADAAAERCWGSFSGAGAGAQGSFESLPVMASALPYLEIPVAGDLGEPGLSLELIGLKTGKVTPVNPPLAPGEKWSNVYVKAPAGPFKVVARDESGTKWFAFKEPREVGRLSYWARQMLKTWKCCLVLGVGCLLWSLAGFARRFSPASETA